MYQASECLRQKPSDADSLLHGVRIKMHFWYLSSVHTADLCVWVRAPSIYVCVCIWLRCWCRLLDVTRRAYQHDDDKRRQRQRSAKSSEKHFFNSLKANKNLLSRRRRKNSFGVEVMGFMLSVNIFFMLFEKLLYVTKELLLLMLLIFSSASANSAKPSFPSFSRLSLYVVSLQKLIYSMDQLTKFYWDMLRHGNWTVERWVLKFYMRFFIYEAGSP